MARRRLEGLVLMKTNLLNGTTAMAMALAAGSFIAAPSTRAADDPAHVFKADEFSLDLFGTLSIGEQTINRLSRDRVRDDGRLGLGIGGNYFFSRIFGVSGEGYTENTSHSFVDNASGSLVFRIPLDRIRLAPYAFGGGGYQFDPIEQAFLHAGGGLEYRFTDAMGLFADARYVATEDSKDFGVGRLGLRLGF